MRQIAEVGQILATVPAARLVQGDAARLISGVTHDSRRVSRGDLFVAIAGERHDARRFVDEAVARGAAGIVAEGPVDTPADTVVVRVPSARAALADLAAAVYGHPNEALRLVGVTGTDGKTTTTHLIHAAIESGGERAGRLSTLGMTTGNGVPPVHFGLTTPEAGDLQRMLADMVDAGCTSAVTEVSSHALSLDRVRGCTFAAAVFTNLSPEHLDFHGSMKDYLAAKAKLFALAAQSTPAGVGVLNADDPASAVIRRSCPPRVLTYGIERAADVMAHDVRLEPDRTTFTLATPWGRGTLISAMPGMMNVSNWLAAATAALALGVPLDAIIAAAEVTTVEGRMQRIDCGQPFQMLVDFAHTPHALATVLRTVRAHTNGRLMVLFGHSGGRDAGNRRPMGSIAAELADVLMVTSDNPLHENPAEIAAEIVAGAHQTVDATCDIRVHLDRGEALRALIAMAEPGDTVVLAGKGHEEYQVLSDRKVAWNDARECRQALAEQGWDRTTHRGAPNWRAAMSG
jgi:UDP-N-acetylmuramoyl-L-alanyl-D-glutamate--2,6-diaminopimelate ligase